MKRFKHMLAVLGTKTELEAFAQKLRKLGYTPDPFPSISVGGTPDKTCGEWYSDNIVGLCTYPRVKQYAYHLFTPIANTEFTLPEQQKEALALASVTVEQPVYENL
jgi:hypothetical protein